MSPRLRLYDLLGVIPEADDLSIRRAYKRLSAPLDPAHQPDRPDAKDRARELRAAYDVLSDARRREEYDEFGDVALAPGFDARATRARAEREKEAEKRRTKAALLAPTAIPSGTPTVDSAGPGQPRDWSIKLAIGPLAARMGRVIRVPVSRPVRCPRCAGSGRRDKLCPACKGQKQIIRYRGDDCAACHAVGLFAHKRVPCRYCKGKGRRGRSLCDSCDGCAEEVKLEACQVCSGMGLRVVPVEEACRACAATGQVPCGRCIGAKTVPKSLSLRLRVPVRAEEGVVYRYAGAGFSSDGGAHGDLCVQFTILARAPRR